MSVPIKLVPISTLDINKLENFPAELDELETNEIARMLASLHKELTEAQNIKKHLTELLLHRMQDQKASILKVQHKDNNIIKITIKKGAMISIPNIDNLLEEKGFSPLEIGNFEFKASWTKAKEIIKEGGIKAEFIKSLFQEKAPTIKIEDEVPNDI